VLDDADRSAIPDGLDPTERFRRALRAALVKAVDSAPVRPTSVSCDREALRSPRCATHTSARPPEGKPEV